MTNIHGIYKDDKEYCSKCGDLLVTDWSNFSPMLWCDNCNASTSEVDYSEFKNMQERRNQWLAKYPAFAYYANMPSNMKVSGYCMGGVTGKLEMPIERNE